MRGWLGLALLLLLLSTIDALSPLQTCQRLRGGESSAAQQQHTLRVRTNDGTKRIIVSNDANLDQLREAAAIQLKIPIEKCNFSKAPNNQMPIHGSGQTTLKQLKISHGDFIYLTDNPPKTNTPHIAGRVRMANRSRGRAIKRTLTEMDDARRAREVEMKAPPYPQCGFVTIDADASRRFADYALELEFEQPLHAHLYGREKGVNGIQVDVMYEPATGDAGIGERARATTIARALGLERVGFAFSHAPRNYHLGGAEIERMCLEYVDAESSSERELKSSGVTTPRRENAGPTLAKNKRPVSKVVKPHSKSSRNFPFVGVLFRPVYEGEDDLMGVVTAEAYELTQQCIDLHKRGFLQAATDGEMRLGPGAGDKQLKVEGKLSETVDCAFLVSRVHDLSKPYRSALRCAFPCAGRGSSIRRVHLKGFLEKQQELHTPFLQIAADWNFLLHVASFLPASELSRVCECVRCVLDAGRYEAGLVDESKLVTAEELIYLHAGLEPPSETSGADEGQIGCFSWMQRLFG